MTKRQIDCNDEAEFRRLAAKIAHHSAALTYLGENAMGVLIAAQARKFHKAEKELRELTFWMQNCITELERPRCRHRDDGRGFCIDCGEPI